MSRKKELILYIFFGVLTTLVNIILYSFLIIFFNVNYIISNIIAWFVSVIFAYITNRKYVFQSKNESILKEFSLFFSSRLFVGFLDTSLLFLFVDIFLINNFISKIITQIIVVISNYILSKLVIFK